MERIILTNRIGQIRYEMLNGRKHLVAPVSMIVPGVLNGSQGPLLYTIDEIAKTVDAWNGMPLVGYHPMTTNGQSQSARDPDVLNTQGLGTVLKAKITDNKLTAEAWFDVSQVENFDRGLEDRFKLLPRLENGQPIELSTGLGVEAIPADEGSEFNGISYTHLATNMKPDHLAVLPDQVGACSLADGCGVLVNQLKLDGLKLEDINQGQLLCVTNTEGGITLSLPQGSYSNPNLEEKVMPKKEDILKEIVGNCNSCGDEDKKVLEALNEEQLQAVQVLVSNQKPVETTTDIPKSFTTDDGIEFAFNEESSKWEMTENKKKKGKKVYNESEDQDLDSKEPKVDNTLTPEQWMANAPPEVQEILNEANHVRNSEKQSLIDTLCVNIDDEDQRKDLINTLADKPLAELRMLTSLVAKKEQPKPSYLGAFTPVDNYGKSKSKIDRDNNLDIPVINWSES